MELFIAQASNGSSDWHPWPGGEGTFYARFASGTGDVKLEITPDTAIASSEIAAGTDTTFTTSGGDGNFKLGAGYYVRATLANGASTPSVYAGIKRIPGP